MNLNDINIIPIYINKGSSFSFKVTGSINIIIILI